MNEAPAPAQFSAAYWENRATKLLGQLEATTEENARLRGCLEGMAYQFGHEFEQGGRRYLGTMGLSNLEDAFEVLGWDDPHPIPVEER